MITVVEVRSYSRYSGETSCEQVTSTSESRAAATSCSPDRPRSALRGLVEQAGILFGPTQDNFVKLVFGHDGTNVIVQFVAETNVNGTFQYPGGQDGFKSTVTGVQGVNLATADYVDLWLSGDPSTGTISAQYVFIHPKVTIIR